MKVNRYNYQELHDAVVANPSQENIAALVEWFENYGMQFWNGEYFRADDFRIFPTYQEVEEDEFECVGYELR